MKKIVAILLSLLLVSGCASKSGSNNSNKINSLEAFKKIVLDDASKTRKKVEEEASKLRSEIKTKKDYYDNIDKIEENFKNLGKDFKALHVRIREYLYELGKSLMPLDEAKEEALYEAVRFITYKKSDDLKGEYENLVKTLGVNQKYYRPLLYEGYNRKDKKESSKVSAASSALSDLCSRINSDFYDTQRSLMLDAESFNSDLAKTIKNKDKEKAQQAFKKFEEAIAKAKNDVDNIKVQLKNS